MTDLERMALEAVINSDYQNGYEPQHFVDHPVWAWDVSDNIACDPSQRGGAIASCVKKGWLVFDGDYGETPDEATLQLTQAGVDAAVAAGIEFGA